MTGKLLAFVVAMTIALVPAAAFAQEAVAVATPVEMGVQLGPAEKSGAEIIISARLATDTPLPAIVRIPLPAGATLAWTGEIAGTDGAGDIQRTGSIEDGTGGQVVVVRLEKYREAQIEALYTAPKADGARLTSTLDWVQSAPAGQVFFVVRMAAGTSDVTIDPAPFGLPQGDAATGRHYALPPSAIPVGGTARLTVGYTLAAGSAPAGTGTVGSSGPLLVVLLAALAIAIAAFVVFAVRSRRAVPDAPVSPAPSGAPAASGPPTGPPLTEAADKDPFDVDWTDPPAGGRHER